MQTDDYTHGQTAARRGAPRCLGSDPDGTAHPDWYRGWDDAESDRLLSLRRMAARAGVPSKWLKSEAEAGRVPGLCAGNRWLFVPSVVVPAITAMAKGAKLTPQEHLLASELAQKLRVGDKPTQKSERYFDWSVGDRLARLQSYMNDPTIRSPNQHTQEKERIAKELGCKNVKVVTNKISKLRKATQ